MFLIKRTIEIAAGINPADAIQAAVKIGEYLQRKQGMETKVAVNVGGYQHHLFWLVTTDSIDDQLDKTAARNADEEWQSLLAPFLEAGLFKDGSTRDEILRIVG